MYNDKQTVIVIVRNNLPVQKALVLAGMYETWVPHVKQGLVLLVIGRNRGIVGVQKGCRQHAKVETPAQEVALQLFPLSLGGKLDYQMVGV